MTDYLVSVAENSNTEDVIFTPTACSLALRKLAVGAELFAFCHAEFISASPLPAGKAGISESIYINPESILKRVQHRIQGDNKVFVQQKLIRKM